MYERFGSTRVFGSLDGLRCLSILAVIFHHSAEGFESHLFPPLTHGDLGVQLFFVISGFLITTLLLRERKKFGDIALGSFYIRRSLRIFPLYYAVLLLYLLLVLAMGHLRPERYAATRDTFLLNLPAFVTYTSDWFVQPYTQWYAARGISMVFVLSWSLAVEEQFYLLWPSVERCGRRWLSLAAAGTLIAVDLIITWLRPPGADPGPLLWIMLRSISTAICCGVLLAHLLDWRRSFEAVYRLLGNPVGLALAAVAALAVPTFMSPESVWFEPAAAMAFMSLTAACVMREDHALAPVLKWRPIAMIGAVSYSIYLLNLLVLDVTTPILKMLALDYLLVRFIVASVGAFVAALVTYHLIEAPFLRWKDHFSRLSPASSAPRVSEPVNATPAIPSEAPI